MMDTKPFWHRFRDSAADRLGHGAAFLISTTAAVAALSMVGRAPEFSAILIGCGMIALAIYKRPPTKIEQRFTVEAMTMNDAQLGLDTGLALHVLHLLREAADTLPESKGDAA